VNDLKFIRNTRFQQLTTEA